MESQSHSEIFDQIKNEVWDAMFIAAFNVIYWTHISRRYHFRAKSVKIFLAVMSSSTVATWGFWHEIDILWKCLSSASALIALSLPILNWERTIEKSSDLRGQWLQISNEYKNLWLDCSLNKSIKNIESNLKNIRSKELSVGKISTADLPVDRKLEKRCSDETKRKLLLRKPE